MCFSGLSYWATDGQWPRLYIQPHILIKGNYNMHCFIMPLGLCTFPMAAIVFLSPFICLVIWKTWSSLTWSVVDSSLFVPPLITLYYNSWLTCPSSSQSMRSLRAKCMPYWSLHLQYLTGILEHVRCLIKLCWMLNEGNVEIGFKNRGFYTNINETKLSLYVQGSGNKSNNN